MLGAISLSSSSHFPAVRYSKAVKPVTLAPVPARLEISPPPTGSATLTNRIGIEDVARRSSATPSPVLVTIRSGAPPTSAMASQRARSGSLAERCSKR